MSSPFRFSIDADYHGSRFDRYLTGAFGWSGGLAQKALRKGWVRLNGKRAKASQRLQSGDEVRITRPGLKVEANTDRKTTEHPAIPKALIDAAKSSVVSETADWLVSLKPSGQVIHAGTKHPYGWVDALGQAFQSDFLAPIGRLDRDVSGLLLLARHRSAARHFDRALRDNKVQRVYTALVLGQLQPQTIDRPLKVKQGLQGQQKTIDAGEGLTAITHVSLAPNHPHNSRASLVEVRIETGRTHQIRAHLASIGHPILGDPRYGNDPSTALSKTLAVDRLLLHAGTLSFPALDDRPQRFEAALPANFTKPLSKL